MEILSILPPLPPPLKKKEGNWKEWGRPVLWGLWIECPTARLPHIRRLNTKDPPSVRAITTGDRSICTAAAATGLNEAVSVHPHTCAHTRGDTKKNTFACIYLLPTHTHTHTHTLSAAPLEPLVANAFFSSSSGGQEQGGRWVVGCWFEYLNYLSPESIGIRTEGGTQGSRAEWWTRPCLGLVRGVFAQGGGVRKVDETWTRMQI